MKVTIPKQDFELHPNQANCPVPGCGRDHSSLRSGIVRFSCVDEQGVIKAPCEAFGGEKRLTQLTEAMNSGQPIEIDSIEHDSKWGRYSVKFPRGSGGDAGYRSKYGGGGSSWQPKYRGQPCPADRWQSFHLGLFDKAFDHIISKIQKSCGDEIAHALCSNPQVMAQIVESSARSFMGQFVMANQENITFVPGFEPKAEAQPQSQPAAQPAAGQPAAQPVAAQPAAQPAQAQPTTQGNGEIASEMGRFMLSQIDAATDRPTLDQLVQQVKTVESIPGDEKGKLHFRAWKRGTDLGV